MTAAITTSCENVIEQLWHSLYPPSHSARDALYKHLATHVTFFTCAVFLRLSKVLTTKHTGGGGGGGGGWGGWGVKD